MNYDYPTEMDPREANWKIVYFSMGEFDRGMTLRTLMNRKPLALYEINTNTWTSLQDGSRRVLRMTTTEIPEWLQGSVGGEKEVLVPEGLDINTQHTISTRTLDDALEFVRKHYGGVVNPRVLDAQAYRGQAN